MMKVLIKDKYNSDKNWEITYIKGGFYLRQFICGRQFGRGSRVTKRWMKEIGLFDMQPIKVTIRKEKKQYA